MVVKKFVHDGDKVFIFDFDESMARDKLTPAIYTVCFDPMSGFYLERNKNKFDVVEKTYGTLTSRIERIINTYTDRPSSTGVLLTGLKGSGKTLLSQKVANKMIDKGLPVVLVETNYSNTGDAFISFLNKIGECVLVFDEFAKVFAQINSPNGSNEKDPQNSLLGIFDGNKSLKRLIFVIDNETYRLNDFFKNRPGRLFYHFEYSRLEEVVIDEYCDDMKISENIKTQIKSSYYKIRNFSFDILKAIVQEHFRYPNDAIAEIVDILNIDTESFYKTVIALTKVSQKDSKKEYEHYRGPQEIDFSNDFYFDVEVKAKGLQVTQDNEEDCYEREDLVSVHARPSYIVFENDKKVVCMNGNYVLEFEKKTKSNYNWAAL